MGNEMRAEHDEVGQRILSCMRRAPRGKYTALQLARNTGLRLAEVQRSLSDLEQAGATMRAAGLVHRQGWSEG